jgi:hypothetical protein
MAPAHLSPGNLKGMKTSGRSEAEAVKAASRKLLKSAWYDATISEASEQESRRGNDMMKITVVVEDGAGEERTFTDYLTDTPFCGLKLRHCCAARGVLAKFEAGLIDQSDFPGPVRVKIGVEKGKGGFGPRNVILDYEAVDSSVVNLVSCAGHG